MEPQTYLPFFFLFVVFPFLTDEHHPDPTSFLRNHFSFIPISTILIQVSLLDHIIIIIKYQSHFRYYPCELSKWFEGLERNKIDSYSFILGISRFPKLVERRGR
ncbi:hypothetical protein L6452_16615 [Arctium lappa]|uniref:Uncharacterized protein n=1 Tax=Arctium lappa TaxID=4217 RepID=A0ACB9C185_ARCLA|nr:hypothetical protein L6452_16615 [Arctium lappa]